MAVLLIIFVEPFIAAQSTEKWFKLTFAQSQRNRCRIFLSTWPMTVYHQDTLITLATKPKMKKKKIFHIISSLIICHVAYQMCAPSFPIIIFYILYVRFIVNRTTRLYYAEILWISSPLNGFDLFYSIAQ